MLCRWGARMSECFEFGEQYIQILPSADISNNDSSTESRVVNCRWMRREVGWLALIHPDMCMLSWAALRQSCLFRAVAMVRHSLFSHHSRNLEESKHFNPSDLGPGRNYAVCDTNWNKHLKQYPFQIHETGVHSVNCSIRYRCLATTYATASS